MSVNFHEYNEVHLRRADALTCFLRGLNHAMQKTDDYEGAMHQLKCIGYSEEFIKSMSEVASDYKKYHKARIVAEQTADLPETLYPTISKDRVEQYAENRKLISAILEHEDRDDLLEQIDDAIFSEVFSEGETMCAKTILDAYMVGDADQMLAEFTGWNLEALFAKARIIPDTKRYFPSKDILPCEITFPFYGKTHIRESEFMYYLRSGNVSSEMCKMIENILEYAKHNFTDAAARCDYLWSMLKGTVDIPEDIIRMITFDE